MDLSIIIVNYNVKEFLHNLIHSIHKASQNLAIETIIVDNASDDGSIEFLTEKHPDIKLIANEINLGFSKANNIGLNIAKGKYLLLLNPDTIVREDTFEKMVKFFEDYPEAGLAGCKILNPDGTLQLACRRSFPGPWTSFCKVTGLSTLFPNSPLFARYNLTYLDENDTYEVDAISGSFMMFPREVYEKVGGLDEQFFMYGEDLDFCYRIQKAGYKVYYHHETQIIHYKGESTKRSGLDETKYFYNAMHLFVKKHLATSFLVELILRSAIIIRRFIAFWGKRKTVVFSILADFIVFNLTLLLAERIYGIFREWEGFPLFSIPIVFTIPALLHIITASFVGIYKKDSLSILKNFLAIFFSFFIVSSITFFFKEYAYSRGVIILTYIMLLFTLLVWRIVAKLLFKVTAPAEEGIGSSVLIVGTSPRSIEIGNKLREKSIDVDPFIGLIGYSHKEIGDKIEGYEVLGSVENMNKIIREKRINTVVFSAEELSYDRIMKIVSDSQPENVEFKLVGSNLDFLVGKESVSMLDDVSVIDLTYNISDPLMKFLKRGFDVILSLKVLFFLYPFIYLSARVTGHSSDFTNFILSVPKVLKGRMSFVGPDYPDQYNNLYLGKKGLTGFWYLNKNHKGGNEKLDIYYAKNQNLWLDLEILGKTINKMWSK